MKLKPLLALALVTGLAACAATPPAGTPGAVGPGQKSAPMQVGPDIIVAVPLDNAWKLISNVDHWADWNSRLSAVTHTAALADGVAFSYKDGGKTVDATLLTLKDPQQLAWKGALAGRQVDLRWTLRAMGPDRTLVSLRAELSPTASPAQVGAAGEETSHWVAAVQVALAKQAAAIQAAAPARASKRRRHRP